MYIIILIIFSLFLDGLEKRRSRVKWQAIVALPCRVQCVDLHIVLFFLFLDVVDSELVRLFTLASYMSVMSFLL